MFKQNGCAAEVENWLQNRASSVERQRYAKWEALIQGAAASSPAINSGSSGSEAQQQRSCRRQSAPAARIPSSSAAGAADTACLQDIRPASASPGGWLHLGTTRSSGQLAAAAYARCPRPQSSSATGAGSSSRSSHRAAAVADPTGPVLRKRHPMAGCTELLQPLSPAAAALLAEAQSSAWAPSSPAPAPAAAAATTAAAGSSSSSSSSSGSSGGGRKNSDPLAVTTTMATHGLKDLCPDLWSSTLPICRPEPAPKKNFISEWAQALQQGAGEAWRPYLASSYQVANDQVHKPMDDFKVRQEQALATWVTKQKLYFGELLSPAAAAGVQRLLAAPAAAGGLAGAERQELVGLLRQLHAVVAPSRRQPYSHELYRPQHSIEDAETTRLMKEQTRIRTMGFPRKVEVKGLRHTAARVSPGSPVSPAAALAAGEAAPAQQEQQEEQPQQQQQLESGAGAGSWKAGTSTSTSSSRSTKGPNPRDNIDTLRSKVPLKWAGSELLPASSAYTAAFGSHPGGRKQQQMEKVVFKEVNVGFGHVDDHLLQQQQQQHSPSAAAATRGSPHKQQQQQQRQQQQAVVFPVPQCYVTSKRLPGELPAATGPDQTTYGTCFRPRAEAEARRAAAAAAEQMAASKKARNKSFIPLSKAGIQLGSSGQWASTYDAEYKSMVIDVSANKAMAAAVSGMFNGPTISWGKIAGLRPADQAAISKMKQQQQRLAKQQGGAEAEGAVAAEAAGAAAAAAAAGGAVDQERA